MILDTNALSAWAEGLTSIEPHLAPADRLIIPSIVIGEYYFGILSRKRKRYEDWLRQYLPLTQIAPVTHSTASIYADIRVDLKQAGKPIPSNDTWIARGFVHDI
ncbi:MAG: type II toxin-antitoxin system VapC family toxin [Verrucomicrobia bacterium]|nr:type II toxin-antitoxin system VapC family toxin [Verrucomicrobiota bacterium]